MNADAVAFLDKLRDGTIPCPPTMLVAFEKAAIQTTTDAVNEAHAGFAKVEKRLGGDRHTVFVPRPRSPQRRPHNEPRIVPVKAPREDHESLLAKQQEDTNMTMVMDDNGLMSQLGKVINGQSTVAKAVLYDLAEERAADMARPGESPIKAKARFYETREGSMILKALRSPYSTGPSFAAPEPAPEPVRKHVTQAETDMATLVAKLRREDPKLKSDGAALLKIAESPQHQSTWRSYKAATAKAAITGGLEGRGPASAQLAVLAAEICADDPSLSQSDARLLVFGDPRNAGLVAAAVAERPAAA